MQQKQEGRRPSGRRDAFRDQRCRTSQNFGLCSDDDWGSKCPSGCRLQALISQTETKIAAKLRTLCQTAKTHEDAAAAAMAAVTRIYNQNRKILVLRQRAELKLVEEADRLAGKTALLRKRSSRLTLKIQELKTEVRRQLEDMYRTEVEVDMMLRSCSGSCKTVLPFGVDHLSFKTHLDHLDHLDHVDHVDHVDQDLLWRRKSSTPSLRVPRLKLNPVAVAPPPEDYKRLPAVQRDLLTLFEDLRLDQVVLEDLEG